MNRLCIVCILVCAIAFLDRGYAQSQPLEILHLTTKIPLPHVKGRIDHMDLDLKTQRVFVAALGNNTVEVVSLKERKLINTLEGFHEPQGVLFLPEKNQLYITSGGNGTCEILDATSFKRVKTIDALDDADNIRLDKSSHLIYVAYGTGGLAGIDPMTARVRHSLPLTQHPESFQIEASGNRIYVNVPNERKVVVFDKKEQQPVATWLLKDADKNFPMALDEQRHLLFIGCRTPARLLVLDTRSGELVSALPIGGDVDDVFFDVQRHLLYISCGEGVVDVYSLEAENTFKHAGEVTTRAGARTSVFVPSLNMLIVAAPKKGSEEAQLLVYTINDLHR